MITIRNNLMADIATRQTGASFDALSRSVAKLSSGQRIVSAKDDAAGMAVTELLRSDVALYRQANRNAQDGISMVQTAEGAMGKIGEILTRMKGLAEQAATESYSDDQRSIMNQEFQELSDEITRIAESTTFNGISLLQESDSLNIHLGGSGTDGTVGVRSADMTAKGLELKGTETTVVLATAATLTESVLTVPAASPQMSPLAVRFQTDGDLFAIFWSGGDRNISEVANAFNIYAEADNPWTPTMYGDQENWNVEDNSYEPAEVVYNPNSGLYELQITAYTAGEGNDAYAIDDFTGSGVDMSQAEVSNGQGPVQEASVA
ncbi:MAG: flagellin, partial [Planctomycetota bacterium]